MAKLSVRVAADTTKFTAEQKVFPSEYFGDEVRLLAVKGEYVCAQLVFCVNDGKKDATAVEYDVSVGDLRADGERVLPSTCASFFVEKLIAVERNWNKNGFHTGRYPDALVPLERAAAYGENCVNAGENGGVWMEIRVPHDLCSGLYVGRITVTADREYIIPLSVEVLDVDLPDAMTVRTLFHTNIHHLLHYEDGDAETLYARYAEYLLAHRVCQTGLTVKDSCTDSEIQNMCRLIDKHTEKGANTVSFGTPEVTENGEKTFDAALLTKQLVALALYSLRIGRNLVQYAVFYDWYIDEPFCSEYVPGRVQRSIERFREVVRTAVDTVKKQPCEDSALYNDVLDSVRGFPCIVTDEYERSFVCKNNPLLAADGTPYLYNMNVVTLCPPFDGYDTPELRKPYGQNGEKWWYGCNCPNSPWAGYHIDDAGEAPRLIAWMMADYGVTGNLYWADNIYTEINTTGKPLFLSDPYGTAHKGSGANGDGTILYPGKKYGVLGPIGSTRLKEIREGHEDYELILMLFDLYRNCGRNAASIFSRMTSCLYCGTRCNDFGGQFERQHEVLLRLLDGVADPMRLTVNAELKGGGVRFEISAADGVRLFYEGKELPKIDGNYLWEGEFQTDGYIRCKAKSANSEKEILLPIGYGLNVEAHEELFAREAVFGEGLTLSLERDMIRRKLIVRSESSPVRIHLRPDPKVCVYTRLGQEIEVCEDCGYTVTTGGTTLDKGTLSRGWNRIDFSVSDPIEEFVCEIKGKIRECALGAMYTVG